MKKLYELSDADYKTLLKASQPLPYMVIGGYVPESPQERANRAWCDLGCRMGFDGMSVEPSDRGGGRFFLAEPTTAKEADDAKP
jgi:hypothetical protein